MQHLIWLFIWLAASVSATMIINRSAFFIPVRNWAIRTHEKLDKLTKIDRKEVNPVILKLIWSIKEILTCSQCCGFWTGMVLYVAAYKEFSLNIIIFGLVSSIASYTYVELIDYVKRS